MTELKPTYGNFRVRGIVRQIELPYALVEDVTSGGLPYRRLRFMVQTNHTNFVQVELFAMKYDEVMIIPRDRDDRRNDRIKFDESVYENVPKDWEIFMGTTVGLTQGADGKNISRTLVPYDAIQEIKKNLKDGDSVFINGGQRFNKYKGDTQQEFEIRSIYRATKPIDFDDEDYAETSTFDQTIIITGSELDKKNNKLNISANIVYDKDGNFVPYEYFIDIGKYKAFALKLRKMKFGSELKVSGLIHSEADIEALSTDTTDEWGEELHQNDGGIIRDVVKSFEITKGYPETLAEAKYTEDDFAPKVDDAFANEDDEWGDSADNPFGDDSSEFEDPFK